MLIDTQIFEKQMLTVILGPKIDISEFSPCRGILITVFVSLPIRLIVAPFLPIIDPM